MVGMAISYKGFLAAGSLDLWRRDGEQGNSRNTKSSSLADGFYRLVNGEAVDTWQLWRQVVSGTDGRKKAA